MPLITSVNNVTVSGSGFVNDLVSALFQWFSAHLNPECLTRFVQVTCPQLWSKGNDLDIKAKDTDMALSVLISHWVSKAFIGVMLYLNEAPLPIYHFSLLHLSSLSQNAASNRRCSYKRASGVCGSVRPVGACVCKVSVCIKRLVFPLSWQRKLSSERSEIAARCSMSVMWAAAHSGLLMSTWCLPSPHAHSCW